MDKLAATKPDDCRSRLQLNSDSGIRDPKNYAGTQLGTARQIPLAQARGKCYNPETAYFRPNYLSSF